MLECTFENGDKTSLRHVVVHAIVEKDGAILLEKRASGILEGEKWALPSGFLSRNESASGGVLRELQEETGWAGEVVSLFRINTKPDRPHEDRQNIAIEFIVKPLKQVVKPDKESTVVAWIPIEDLPPVEQFAFDHGESVQLYLNYKQNPHDLPLIV